MYRTMLLVAALAAASCAPAPIDPDRPSFVPAASPLAGVVDDAATLRAPDNDARREAVLALAARYGLTARVEPFPNDSTRGRDPRPEGANVVISVGDAGPIVVVGAHFDAVHRRDGTLVDGMVDNAAGVVVVLRAAQALRDAALGRRVEFVLFDMEEIGLVGSRHYVAARGAENIAVMLNVDVAAYGDTLIYGNTADGHDVLYASVERACHALGVRCIDFPRAPPSDNLSFGRAGIPHVGLSIVPQLEAHQLWLLVNGGEFSGLREGFLPDVLHTIHTEHDTVERLDAAAMTLAYNMLTTLIVEAAR